MMTLKRITRTALAGLLVAACLSIAACQSTTTRSASIPGPSGLPDATLEASVFFSTGRTLIEETRLIDAKNKYADALAKLLAADPRDHQGVAIVQPTAKVNSVKFKDGVVTVDWNKEVLTFVAEPKEKTLALAAILETLGQFPEVKKVGFTVEGKTSGTIDGHDVEKFWGSLSLKGQPWPALRVKRPSAETTDAANNY